MKTHILQLEEYDDILSARDKMGWARGERLLLVWPERRAILERRLDLILLQRRAAGLGVELALVTQHTEVRYQALRLGIPVFKSLRQAQSDQWRLPHRFRHIRPPARPTRARQAAPPPVPPTDSRPDETPSLPRALARPENEPERVYTFRQRLGIFGLGVLAVLAIAATLLPQAEIRYTPQTRVQDVLINVHAGPAIPAPDLTGAVPAHWRRITVEGRQTIPVSGSVRLPDQLASGEATFTNLTDQPIDIPLGTVARPAGERPARFAVARSGRLPAGPGTTVNLPVQALAPGEAGNLPAGSLIALEGRLGTQVSVENARPTRGGADRQEPAATAEDRRRLAETLRQALEQTARQELAAQLQKDDLLLPYSLKLAAVHEEIYSPPADLPLTLPSDQISLHLRLEYQILAVSGADLRSLAEAVFDVNLPAGFRPQSDRLRWEILGLPQPGADGNSYWQMHATRPILAQASAEAAGPAVLGLPPGMAARRLQAALPLEEPPQIQVLPAWWPTLPILPFRLRLIDVTQAGN